MKIQTKLVIEFIVLIVLISIISFLSLINTKEITDSFVVLNEEIIPITQYLKDIRSAVSEVVSSTMKLLTLQEETKYATDDQLLQLEQEREHELYEIQVAKTKFLESFSALNQLDSQFLDIEEPKNAIKKNWDQIILDSETILKLKSAGITGNEVLQKIDKLEEDEQLMINEIEYTISLFEGTIKEREQNVKSITDYTYLTIVITLVIFAIFSASMKYAVFGSIITPLYKLKKTAQEIANENFIKTEIGGNDEISELGKEIDVMAEKLIESRQNLIQSERMSTIGMFSSRIAHDLRNSLHVIQNNIELLKEKISPDDAKTVERFTRIERSISSISHIVSDMLSFVRPNPLNLETTSLLKIVNSIVSNIQKSEHLEFILPKNDLVISCDTRKLEIVFTNLILNAIQAVHERGKITIRMEDLGSDILVEFEDSGPGVPPEILPKIFEPLFTTKNTGTGLGLVSCKSFVEQHGGTITVKNNPTVFAVKLPKNPAKQN